ncbi:hypothetical protein HMPREF1987_00990 [Peptostreptococcaceae bacterium oral taxon 113 str. W5053]|nr:hypothetical protein HMPREF1987_00990 [Peptostreptococcaceae bacterium oral taxon 113 str. W5053]
MNINNFFKNNKKEIDYLHNFIKNTLIKIGVEFEKERDFWEYGNTLLSIYYSCKSVKIYTLTDAMIEIFTHKYSSKFFPELTHSTYEQYRDYFDSQYRAVINEITKMNISDIKICDFGCGIAHLGLVLVEIGKVSQYVGCDNNDYIIKLNELLVENYSNNSHKMKFVNTSLKSVDSVDIDVWIFFNIIKHFTNVEINKWIEWVKIQKSKVIIQDNDKILNKINTILNENSVNFIYDGGFIIL